MIKIENVLNAVLDPTRNASVQRIWNDDFGCEELILIDNHTVWSMSVYSIEDILRNVT